MRIVAIDECPVDIEQRADPELFSQSHEPGRSGFNARARLLDCGIGVAFFQAALRISPPRVGCSGWNYKSWQGRFYPKTVPPRAWLRHYAETFDTVEANGTFYRLPEAAIFAAWRRDLPRGFVMAVKASRFLTHMKRLTNPNEPLERLISRASALGPHLGPFLYQLPPNMRLDLQRLEAFLAALPHASARRRLQHVMEFRHPSWYVAETFALLDRHHVSMCVHDKRGSTIRAPFIGPVVYVRFHGTSGEYHGGYSSPALSRWAHRLAEHSRAGRRVYAYFNNDPDAVATENAQTLGHQLARILGLDG